MEVRAEPMRCSPAIRAAGVDPIGSAVTRTSFLVVDHPLPWAKDVGDEAALAPVHDALRAAPGPWRLQATVPEPSGTRRVVRYRLPDGPFSGYERLAVETDPDGAVAAAVALLEQEGGAGPPDEPAGDLLVCTHGKRDACCGSSGTQFWQDLAVRPDLVPRGTRIGRTSHTGGHRFAATALVLPQGTCWAWLDVAVLFHVLARDVEFAAVADRYRGCTAFATVEEQVAERAVAIEVGWSWFDRPRAAAVVDRDGATAVVELTDGEARWRVRTEQTGTSPVPSCPGLLEEAPKSAPVVGVVGVERAA